MLYEFFAPRLDYLLFIHALALFFLSAFAGQFFRDGRKLSWVWLSMFALCMGLGLVLRLVAEAMPEPGRLADVSQSVRALASFFLVLFAMHGIVSRRARGVGYLVAAVLAVLPSAGAAFVGGHGFHLAVVLGLAPCAGLLALECVRRNARQWRERPGLVPAGAPLLALYLAVLTLAPALHVLYRLLAGGPQEPDFALPPVPHAVAGAVACVAVVAALARSGVFRVRLDGGERLGRLAYAFGLSAVGRGRVRGLRGDGHPGRARREQHEGRAVYARGRGGQRPGPRRGHGSAPGRRRRGPRVLQAAAHAADQDPPGQPRPALRLPCGPAPGPQGRHHPGHPSLQPQWTTPCPARSTRRPPAEELVAIFSSGKTALVGPYTDRWGTWISGFAPVKNEYGAILGVVGMDIRARSLQANVAMSRFMGIVMAFLLSVIGAAAGIILQRNRELAMVNACLASEMTERESAERSLADSERKYPPRRGDGQRRHSYFFRPGWCATPIPCLRGACTPRARTLWASAMEALFPEADASERVRSFPRRAHGGRRIRQPHGDGP